MTIGDEADESRDVYRTFSVMSPIDDDLLDRNALSYYLQADEADNIPNSARPDLYVTCGQHERLQTIMRSNFRNLIEEDLLIWLAALIVVMAIILMIIICCYINFAKRRIVEPLKELTSKLENPKEWVEEQKKKQKKVAEEDQELLEKNFDSNFAARKSTRRARVNTEE